MKTSESLTRYKESEWIKKLANMRISVLWDRRASLTEDPEGIGCVENALQETMGVLDRFSGDERNARVEAAEGRLGPGYSAAPRTHLRRTSSATCS
jgi:hypothetical protein